MIWFDLDNAPHVPLFRPILKILDEREQKYVLTTREFAQTSNLLSFWKIEYKLIGKHAGKNKFRKIGNLLNRAYQLSQYIKPFKPDLAISHGSRALLLTARFNDIKSLTLFDYEYTESRIFNYFSDYILMPEIIPQQRLEQAGFNLKKIIRYKGFKEELYLSSFVPDKDFRKQINVDEDEILVVIRPSSMVANYHDIKSEQLLISAINYFSEFQNVTCIVVNRTEVEREFIESNVKSRNYRFLEKTVDGLQLLFAADLSVSGGGTMNRESALLGTKTYSIFTGRRPYMDEFLHENCKLVFIEKPDDVKNIEVVRRKKDFSVRFKNNLAEEVTNIILDFKK